MINVGILINSIEYILEANSRAAGQGIPRIVLDLTLITVLQHPAAEPSPKP
jgi:hypothetical protein